MRVWDGAALAEVASFDLKGRWRQTGSDGAKGMAELVSGMRHVVEQVRLLRGCSSSAPLLVRRGHLGNERVRRRAKPSRTPSWTCCSRT